MESKSPAMQSPLSFVRRKAVVIPVLLGVVLTLFYWPTFRWLYNSWTAGGLFSQDSGNYYSHGFLVPIVAGFLLWVKREHLKIGQPSTFGVYVLAVGAAVYFAGHILDIRVLGALSLVIVLGALSLLFFGIRATRAILFPLGFLLLMIPPPFIQDFGYQLQKISVQSAGWVTDVMRLPVTTSGPEIELEGTAFTVDLACSGLNSVVALVALTAVYLYMLRGPMYRRTGILLLAIPIAIVANLFRIVSIIVIAYHYDQDTAMTFHDWSDPLFFISAFLLVVLLSRLSNCRLNLDALLTERPG